ncbi:MAG TPA: acyltransferase family protein [Trebonia sp.]|nr:acyltransferase family protein [Trebonia sp.]
MGELAVAPRQAAQGSGKSEDGRGFRRDIQGLRAVAVGLVVVYHVYPNVLPGGFVGVDVFFVISGYLITGHLWRGYAATGKVGLVDFWGRRARRLIPAAALVLAVTWLMSRLIGHATQLPGLSRQILASALYFQNWQLASDAVNYLTSSAAATPVQHFWSLSVEEQFYLVWPLLFLLAALITRRREKACRHRKTRPVAVWVLTTALVLASFAYSVYYTRTDPAAAYFVTTTRMWELGLGGLLAIAPAGLTRMLARQGWLAWLGLAVVVTSALALNGKSAFPGWIALLPVAGAAAMLAAGSSAGRYGPAWLTSASPMVFLGGISYSLYLWHWPVINLYTTWSGRVPGLVTGPSLIAASLLLAWLTKVLIEDPVRLAKALRGHAWRSVSTALAAAVPLALAGSYLATLPSPLTGPLPAGYPGAAVLAGVARDVPAKPVLPPPLAMSVPGYWAQNCLGTQHAVAETVCTFGDTVNPKLTVALVGDSVAGNWWEALNIIANQEHWKLVTDLHANCAWTATLMNDPDNGTPYTTCREWGASVLHDLTTKIRPDVVITTAHISMISSAYPKGGPQSRADIGAGEAAYWTQLEDHGIKVVAITETPEMRYLNQAACVLDHGPESSQCLVPTSEAIWPDPPTMFAARAMRGRVPVVDMNDLICGPQDCSPVVGNVLVYMDEHHLTPQYSQTLAPFLKQRLLATGLFGT